MAIYLIHFDQPYHHAKHYLGFVDTDRRSLEEALQSRLAYHRSGQGSRLIKAVSAQGIAWGVVRIWEDGTRTEERKLKGHSSTRLCPACNPTFSGYGKLRGSLVGEAVAGFQPLLV